MTTRTWCCMSLSQAPENGSHTHTFRYKHIFLMLWILFRSHKEFNLSQFAGLGFSSALSPSFYPYGDTFNWSTELCVSRMMCRSFFSVRVCVCGNGLWMLLRKMEHLMRFTCLLCGITCSICNTNSVFWMCVCLVLFLFFLHIFLCRSFVSRHFLNFVFSFCAQLILCFGSQVTLHIPYVMLKASSTATPVASMFENGKILTKWPTYSQRRWYQDVMQRIKQCFQNALMWNSRKHNLIVFQRWIELVVAHSTITASEKAETATTQNLVDANLEPECSFFRWYERLGLFSGIVHHHRIMSVCDW